MLLLQVVYLILEFSAADLEQPMLTNTASHHHHPATSSDVHFGIRCNPASYFQQICPTGDLCRDDGFLTCGKDPYHGVAYCICPPYDHHLHGSRPIKCNLNFPQVCPTGHLCSPKILRCDKSIGTCTCPEYRDFHVEDFDKIDDDENLYDIYDEEFFDNIDDSLPVDVFHDEFDYYYDEDGNLHYPNDIDDHLYIYGEDHFDYDDLYALFHDDHHVSDHHVSDHHVPDHHRVHNSRHCNPNADFVSLCPSGHECRNDVLTCRVDTYYNVEYCECPLENDVEPEEVPAHNIPNHHPHVPAHHEPHHPHVPAHEPHHPHVPAHEPHHPHVPAHNHPVHCDPNSVDTQICPSGHLCSPALDCVEKQQVTTTVQDVHCNPYQNQICPNGSPCNRHELDCEYSHDSSSLLYCYCPVDPASSHHAHVPSHQHLPHPNIDYCICPSHEIHVPSHEIHVPSHEIHVPSHETHVPSHVHVTHHQNQHTPHVHNQDGDASNPNPHTHPEILISEPYQPENTAISDEFHEIVEGTCDFGNCDADDSIFRNYLKTVRLSHNHHVTSSNLHILRQQFMGVYKVRCGCDPSCIHFKDCCVDYANFCEQP